MMGSNRWSHVELNPTGFQPPPSSPHPIWEGEGAHVWVLRAVGARVPCSAPQLLGTERSGHSGEGSEDRELC